MTRRSYSAAVRRFATLLGASAALASCDAGERLRELGDQPRTAHERYMRALADAGLDETVLGRDWIEASDSVLRAPHDVTLPFRETGVFLRAEVRAVAYRLSLSAGQRLTFAVRVDGLPLRLFVDLFEQTGDSARPLELRASAEGGVPEDSSAPPTSAGSMTFSIEHEARRAATYVVRVQPELLRDGRFEVLAAVAPILAFPVEGRGNGAVQSFFGADRDAGRRVHHGIDIFAPRGTSVLAATDGVVRSVRPNNLGGNVVWLSDPERGQSLYYAHLDTQVVTAGQRVRLGDTLGFVGNTGNARTTKPHLHFGIYRRGEGPVDPFPWVRRVIATPPPLVADTKRLGGEGRTTRSTTVVLNAPSARGDTLRTVPRDTPVQIVGAAGTWYRVELADGVAGYVPARFTAPPRNSSQ